MKLFWRWHNKGLREVRVWKDDWSGDMFEIMDETQMIIFRETLSRFGGSLEESEDNE